MSYGHETAVTTNEITAAGLCVEGKVKQVRILEKTGKLS